TAVSSQRSAVSIRVRDLECIRALLRTQLEKTSSLPFLSHPHRGRLPCVRPAVAEEPGRREICSAAAGQLYPPHRAATAAGRRHSQRAGVFAAALLAAGGAESRRISLR